MSLLKLSTAEENYLKAIFKLSQQDTAPVSNNAISREMGTSAASVTDMITRLHKKKLINYQKHKGVRLTEKGAGIATHLVRKHRLWETFLVDKLKFNWDEVHEIAEQLEHIKSPTLVDRLDEFLGYPRYDPHGDPIPDADGRILPRPSIALSELAVNQLAVIVGVHDHASEFLRYLDRAELLLGVELVVTERFAYDQSMALRLASGRQLLVSLQVGQNLYVQIK